MASGQKTYIEKQAEAANRERAAKAAALRKAQDADVLQRIKNARNRASQERTVDSQKIQERFASRAVSRISKDFNGLIKSRRIRAAGRDAQQWGRRTGNPLARAVVQLEHTYDGSPELRAYTDFTTASCYVNAAKVPRYTQRDDVKRWVARIRGAMYHELGHMQFSIPSRMVIERADFTLDEVAALQPDLKLITEKKVKNSWTGSMKVLHDSFGEVHRAWNMLEDQRMETAVVRDYPYAPNYLTPLITKLMILDSDKRELSWLLIGGRKYLPVEIRDASRDRFNEWFDTQTQAVKDLLHTDQTVTPADQWLEIVDDYKQATTCVDMFVAMCAAQLWLEQLEIQSDDESHDNHQYEPMDASEMGRREKGGATQPGQERQNVRGEGKGEDGEDGEGDGEGGKEGTPSKSASNDKAPHETFGTLEEIATEAIEDALNGLPADATIGESLREAEGDGLLPYDRQTDELPSEWVDKANTVSVGIERALQAFVTANEPIWKARQQVGVLDPLAYRTRETGAIDYRRYLDDSGREGMDVHVSMLCDNSGSMGGSMGALSAALLAMANACERVGAGYDIVLWSTEYYRVDEPTVPTLYPHLGGTEVVPALNDLKNAPIGQHVNNHLVLLFTDGAWYDNPDLSKYRDNDQHINRKFVLAKYGSAGSQDYGADKVVQLTDILDFPQLLEAGLRELAGGRN